MSKLYVLCECDENSTTDHSQEAISYSELADYTHAEQVHRHGFCLCEDGPKVYDDCHKLDECEECQAEEQPCLVCGESYPPNGLVTCDNCEVDK